MSRAFPAFRVGNRVRKRPPTACGGRAHSRSRSGSDTRAITGRDGLLLRARLTPIVKSAPSSGPGNRERAPTVRPASFELPRRLPGEPSARSSPILLGADPHRRQHWRTDVHRHGPAVSPLLAAARPPNKPPNNVSGIQPASVERPLELGLILRIPSLVTALRPVNMANE